MNNALVTVIVISYNQGKYIRENLDSIKAQTYQNIELIVGDDASQDDSVEVFESWLTENNYPVAFRNYHQQNTGLATMLNECIAKGTGKYIKLIAADDFLHPEYLTQCITEAETKNADLVFTQATTVDMFSNRLQENYFPIPDEPLKDMGRKLARANYISGATLFFRKSALLQLLPIPPAIRLEDYYQVLHAWQLQLRFGYLPENYIFYRRHESNITALRVVELEAETTLLQLQFFRRKEYARIINIGIKEKTLAYGRTYTRKVFPQYLKYPYVSFRNLFKLVRHSVI